MEQGGGINIGRIVATGLDAFGRNAPAFLGLAVLLVGIPTFASQYWVLDQAVGGQAIATSPGTWLVIITLVNTFVPLATGALLQGFVAQAVIRRLNGRPAEVGRSIGAALQMAVPLVILSVLVALIITIGLLLVVVPGIIFWLVLVVAVPALVVERRGVIQSMVRSEALTSGSKAMIFLFALLLVLMSVVISFLAGFLAPLAISLAGPGFVAPALTGAIAESARSAIAAAILSSLYVELLRVKEGGGADDVAAIFE